jgi:hypothetical protein
MRRHSPGSAEDDHERGERPPADPVSGAGQWVDVRAVQQHQRDHGRVAGSGVLGLDITNRVIAAVGLAAGTASLLWQSITWQLSGSRAKAKMLKAAIQTHAGH